MMTKFKKWDMVTYNNRGGVITDKKKGKFHVSVPSMKMTATMVDPEELTPYERRMDVGLCQEFEEDQTTNPLTGRRIQRGKATWERLDEQCKMLKVIFTLEDKEVRLDGRIWRKGQKGWEAVGYMDRNGKSIYRRK